eukprot:TRINITY_DN6116_c0_g1_i1.p1 TRINITY_DN6116_c0_g1~~TRINITY_DN6116_c0_g1_i1.p1  ORF type:complete len:1294 (-),score=319.31 TRINITY_DN6116_c0_g1_i1:306-4187(-)
MDDGKGKWTWQVAGFDHSSQHPEEDSSGSRSMARRHSISSASLQSEFPKHFVSKKLIQLKENVSATRAEWLALRQEATDLQEYSNAKISRVTRYLGFLAEKAHNLDQISQETESRIASLILEKKRLFNDLQTLKGNIRIVCRVRPLFEHEGPSVIDFPDDFTIRIKSGAERFKYSKEQFEFDRVFGPHIDQGDFFHEVQPLVQSAFDGFNVSIFAYGSKGSGKTYTMEGSSHNRGLYFRAFEELFDLANATAMYSSKVYFYVTMLDLCNDEIYDILSSSNEYPSKFNMHPTTGTLQLAQEKVENPTDFSAVLKRGACVREMSHLSSQSSIYSHLIVTIHIQHYNVITGECQNSKLSLIDLAGVEALAEGGNGEFVDSFSQACSSISVLGDVISALTAMKDDVPYENSKLTQVLSDSLGGSSKTLLIVNVSPSYSDIHATMSSLKFASRAANVEQALRNHDSISNWRNLVNEIREEVTQKQTQVLDAREEIMSLKNALKEAEDQSLLLFNEAQKAWKLVFTIQNDVKSHDASLQEKELEEENVRLRSQVAHLTTVEQEQKIHLRECTALIQSLESKVRDLEKKLADAQLKSRQPEGDNEEAMKCRDGSLYALPIVRRLEEELAKRDKLIERLHKENQKLFERLTDRPVSAHVPKVSNNESKGFEDSQLEDSLKKENVQSQIQGQLSLPGAGGATGGSLALLKPSSEKVITTPAGEYLTNALMDFDPDQFETPAALADGANKLLMLVLAAVIKAGAPREHEILAEIRDAVLAFIHKMEHRGAMDTMLVSRVRILYIRSLVSRSPELHSLKVPPVERFLEKANAGRSRNVSRGSSRDSSPGRSPHSYEISAHSDSIDDNVHGFKVNIKQDKKSKLSSLVLKIRGIDEEAWRQHVTSGKLKDLNEEARTFAVGNKSLAALFVHTPAGELQRQIRAWLAEKFDFLSVTGGDGSGVSGQLELLATAIMDGWMAGLGIPQHPSTDALGQLLSEYTKLVYTSQLQNLKDIAGTLSAEEAEDLSNVVRLRSALESVEHKRRKILQQIRTDAALLTKEQGGSPVRNPSTAEEDARLASLVSLEDILRRVQDVDEKASGKAVPTSKKKALLAALDELTERMSSLLTFDQPCAQRHVARVRQKVENIDELNESHPSFESDVVKWTVLQFNTGSTPPFIVKCGANSNLDLVVKGQAKLDDKASHEVVAVIPKPTALEPLTLEEIKHLLSQLPEALCHLSLARTVDGTRARYLRLYRTLAERVPSLKGVALELEKGMSSTQSVTMSSTQSNASAQLRWKSQSDSGGR